MHPFRPHLKVAVQAAVLCSRGAFGQHLSSTSSSLTDTAQYTKTNDTDITTSIDLSNEALIRAMILETFPNHQIIGEEESSSSSTTTSSSAPPDLQRPTWIIDPIDGTTNFMAGNPLCCISIGFVERGISKVGVVISGLGELFVAVEGEGAYRNGVRVRVDARGEEDVERTDMADRRGSQEFFDAGEREEDLEVDHLEVVPKKLRDCNVCVEFGYERDAKSIDVMTGTVGKILKHGCRSIRMMGSGVLDLIFVALGRYDAVYCGVAGEGWKVWDYAAASVFVRESGCLISNWGEMDVVGGPSDSSDSSSFNMYGKTCVCCRSRSVQEELVTILRDTAGNPRFP